MSLLPAILAIVVAGTDPVVGGASTAPANGGSTKSVTLSASTAYLEWSGPVHLKLEHTPQEVVVRFSEPLSDKAIDDFAAVAGAEIADLRWNDTSLVLQPAAGRRITASIDGNRLQVTFAPDDTSADLPPDDGGISRLNVELALVQAQADAAAGFTGQARKRLASLAQDYPDDPQVQRALADTEAADGAIGVAARRYRKIEANDRTAKRIIAEANGRLTSAVTMRAGKAFAQTEAQLIDGRVPLNSSILVGGAIRHVRTRADSVAGAAGVVNGVREQHLVGELGAELTMGSSARLGLLGAANLDGGPVGASARLHLGWQERQARLALAYRLPDSSTAEQSVFGGYISKVGLGGTVRLTPELTMQGDVGWAAYGLKRSGIGAKTLTALGGLDYLLRRGSPSLTISYRLDAEHVLDLAEEEGQFLLPLADRENHTAQLNASMRLAGVQLTGAVGWTVDREGESSGLTASVGSVAQLGDTWRIESVAGVSSISRPAIAGRQTLLRLSISKALRGW